MTETGTLHDLIERFRGMLCDSWRRNSLLIGSKPPHDSAIPGHGYVCCYCGKDRKGHTPECPYDVIMQESARAVDGFRALADADPDGHRGQLRTEALEELLAACQSLVEVDIVFGHPACVRVQKAILGVARLRSKLTPGQAEKIGRDCCHGAIKNMLDERVAVMGAPQRFRKKPVVVEAVQWFRVGNVEGVEPCDRHRFKQDCKECGHDSDGHGQIETLEGMMRVCPGDWIITGVKNEKYPCKPGIFKLTYDPVEDPDDKILETDGVS